ncbi:heme ABC exporter ATP-binding protein CcmA [Sphingomonas glaciei]|uniref:Heme ABC exporter ATP-binding protein CcmA n=1 Tax=Sphingomonas glaciei TaxID=2938948 RepID=A0ABY5MUJ2_9SPHN|nr:heme ABC exporter ATP-binding protein CcmA [Sphingomonas glaciei]UUR07084.1 heme ABC exporter ATP-binding protein CcmA [Sphingomonas glaciei]
MSLLALHNVACWRGGRLLFEGLNVELGAGEAMLVTGPNGTGKSSLLRLAAGLLRPLGGTVEVAPCALADERPALDPELPLARAIALWTPVGGDIPAALVATGLEALADVPVRLLSTGQLRRASLARVSLSAAPLWLLDEPANGLDTASLDLLTALVSRHIACGGAILAASHQPLGGAQWRTLELAR